MVFRLDDEAIVFPDPALAEEDGLLAIGGDLRPERLVLAYHYGIFPWFNEDDPICWYAPHERCVIYPERVKMSKSMAKVFKSEVFRLSFDEAFPSVIAHCATVTRRDEPGTWITGQMQQAYIRLHELGYARSVEVWQGEQLVGGLYGVQINDVFCGESMFSLVSNASKAALIWLCEQGGYSLIDCQLPNDHLMSLGAEMISREVYQEILS
jgi:leucyl/phenylalanyl-tRNA--protein transferase